MNSSNSKVSQAINESLSNYIESELNLDASKFKFIVSIAYSDDVLLDVKVPLLPLKLPKDFFFHVITYASNAVREAGEERFPIVKPHLARGQKIAA